MIKLKKLKQKLISEDTISFNCNKEELRERIDGLLKTHEEKKKSSQCGLVGSYDSKKKLYKIKYRYRPYEKNTASVIEDYYILAELSGQGKRTELHYMFIADSSDLIYKRIIGAICCVTSLWMMFYAYSTGRFGWMLLTLLIAVFMCGVLMIVSKGDDRMTAEKLVPLFKDGLTDCKEQ